MRSRPWQRGSSSRAEEESWLLERISQRANAWGAGLGGVEIKASEYIQACNLGDRYWLYAVFDCASAHPLLVRVRHPFQKLIARAMGSVVIAGREYSGECGL